MFSPEQSVEIVSTQRGLLNLATEVARNGRVRGGTPRAAVSGPAFSLQAVLNLCTLIHRAMYK